MTDEEILEEVIDLPAAARSGFLDRACASDAGQRERLAALLQGHTEAGDFLQVPAVSRPALIPREQAGDIIDRYQLLERIGDGGCGVVWSAEQLEPLHRKVAFKIIKLGMNTRTVVARFEAERQALAMMDHPSIAHVFDAGVTSTGRPYFVMELVAGVPITKYCDAHRLTTGQRLELFIRVCEAVQHAHQKGVVHRDLKPSNILVADFEGVAVPKVIDFGIAKAIQSRGTEDPAATTDQFVGTPVYMSPEQAASDELDVDTRSDVYTLGILLFELLTGSLPLDTRDLLRGSLDEIRRRVRDTPPQTPSTRLKTLTPAEQDQRADLRRTTPTELAGQLHGDLGWIVMRCLEKERNRRYDSASALAADLRRHLRHEPVVARPWTRLYLTRQLLRRHRVTFAALAAVAAVVVVGAGVSTWQAVRATRAEKEQSRLRQEAETQERLTRRRAYAADLNLAQQALANDNLGQAKRLLQRYVPKAGESDLRGWEWRYLWQQCRNEAVAEIARIAAPVSWLAASPDGTWLAVGQDDGGELLLRQLRTREFVRVAAGAGAVRAAFSPVAPVLALAYSERRDAALAHRIRIWNLATRRTVAEWATTLPPGALFFSADGETLVATGGGRSSPAERWRVSTGERLGGLPAAGGPTWAVTADLNLAAREVQRDGRSLIQVLDLRTGQERWSIDASEENISALAFSPDGRLLASAAGYSDTDIRLWDVASGRLVQLMEGHRTYVSALAFMPDGRTLVSTSKDQTVRTWEVSTGALQRTFRGHQLEVHSLALLGDDTSFVSGSKDGFVLQWSTKSPGHESLVRLGESVVSWTFTPDSQAVVTLDGSGHVATRTGEFFSTIQSSFHVGSLARQPQAAAFAREASRLAVVGEHGDVRVFDWATQRPVTVLSTGIERVAVVGFRHAGRALLLADRSGTAAGHELHEWDLASGRKTRSWAASEPAPQQFTLSPDGHYAGFRGGEGSVTVIDLVSGAEKILPGRGPMVTSVNLSPDNRFVAATSGVGWARVWRLGEARLASELTGFVLGVHSLTFSPDGTRLITGSGNDEALRLWDAETFEPLLTLGAHGSRFTLTTMSPDGHLIGSRNMPGRLHLWRAPPLAEIDRAPAQPSAMQ